VARGLNEEQAAVNASILDVTLSLSCELLAQVGRVLILDILDDWVPAGYPSAPCVGSVQFYR
jgi:hypothetical protein